MPKTGTGSLEVPKHISDMWKSKGAGREELLDHYLNECQGNKANFFMSPSLGLLAFEPPSAGEVPQDRRAEVQAGPSRLFQGPRWLLHRAANEGCLALQSAHASNLKPLFITLMGSPSTIPVPWFHFRKRIKAIKKFCTDPRRKRVLRGGTSPSRNDPTSQALGSGPWAARWSQTFASCSRRSQWFGTL